MQKQIIELEKEIDRLQAELAYTKKLCKLEEALRRRAIKHLNDVLERGRK